MARDVCALLATMATGVVYSFITGLGRKKGDGVYET
jgi:hypothetical protein